MLIGQLVWCLEIWASFMTIRSSLTTPTPAVLAPGSWPPLPNRTRMILAMVKCLASPLSSLSLTLSNKLASPATSLPECARGTGGLDSDSEMDFGINHKDNFGCDLGSFYLNSQNSLLRFVERRLTFRMFSLLLQFVSESGLIVPDTIMNDKANFNFGCIYSHFGNIILLLGINFCLFLKFCNKIQNLLAKLSYIFLFVIVDWRCS